MEDQVDGQDQCLLVGVREDLEDTDLGDLEGAGRQARLKYLFSCILQLKFIFLFRNRASQVEVEVVTVAQEDQVDQAGGKLIETERLTLELCKIHSLY